MSRTPQEEIAHWKKEAEAAKAALAELEESSHILEQELDKEIKQLQQQLKDERTKKAQLERTSDTSKEKAEREAFTAKKELTKLTTDFQALQKKHEDLSVRFREIEQRNDELENQTRQSEMTISMLETRLDTHLEDAALLRVTLDEERESTERLRETIKDLKSDLEVARMQKGSASSIPVSPKGTPRSLSPAPPPSSPRGATHKHVAHTSTPLGGALTRAQAMGQLSEVLERFKVIEARLMSGAALWRLSMQADRK